MPEFSSLSKGESLLAGNKKNDSLACKQTGGDAAKIAGAAIAFGAVAGAVAVGAAQSSLFASGVGGTSATQAAATNSLSSASSGVTSSTSAAQSKATDAIVQGPGSESNASLSSAQGDVTSAQTDASKLAGEKRAGADAQVADSKSSVINAQNYLATKTTDSQAAASTQKTALAGKTTQALGTAPPAVTGLAKPTAGKTPEAPLPVNVPPPAQTVEAEVPKPASNLAIQAPANASTPTTKPASAAATQTIADEKLKQVVLSKEEQDKCIDRRIFIANGLISMGTQALRTQSLIQSFQDQTRKVDTGQGSTLQQRAGGTLFQVIKTGVPDPNDSRAGRALAQKEKGIFVGLNQAWTALRNAELAVKFNVKCEDLSTFSNVTSQRDAFTIALGNLFTASGTWIDIQNEKEFIAFINKIVPIWIKINEIVFMLPDDILVSANIKKGTSK